MKNEARQTLPSQQQQDAYVIPPSPRRGEIWDVNWSPGRGAEQQGTRPALIIQNDRGNTSPSYPLTIDLFQNPCSKLYMPAIRLKRNLKRLRRLRYLSAMILKRFKAPMTCSLTTRWLEILWLLRLSSWVSG